jgi:hypothetical protein
MFRKNISPPSSKSKIKTRKKVAETGGKLRFNKKPTEAGGNLRLSLTSVYFSTLKIEAINTSEMSDCFNYMALYSRKVYFS